MKTLTFLTTSNKSLGRKPPPIMEVAITANGYEKPIFHSNDFNRKDFMNSNEKRFSQ